MFSLARRLHEAGVLGINRRNAEYILVHNDRRFYPLVDDKVLTKTIAQEKGIAVPELYGTIEIQAQVADIPDIVAGHAVSLVFGCAVCFHVAVNRSCKRGFEPA